MENRMGTEKVGRLVLTTGIPLMLSLLINSLYNLVLHGKLGQTPPHQSPTVTASPQGEAFQCQAFPLRGRCPVRGG